MIPIRAQIVARVIVALLVPALALGGVAQPAANGQEATPRSGMSLVGVAPLPLSGETRTAFDAYVTDALDRYGVPGAAVAVVQDGEIVYLEGFGVTEAGGTSPVTPDTMFMVGSITKSLTTMLAAALVDTGELSWDTRLVDILPGFATADPALTERLTVWDAFCNCTGLPSPNLDLYFGAGPETPAAVASALTDVSPVVPYGEEFIYSNLLIAAGGYALGAVTMGDAGVGQAYDAALRARVLDPIGMTHSTFDPDAVVATGDYAMPHAVDLSSDLRTLPLSAERWVEPVRPSGGLWSNAREMAHYLQTELEDGVAPDGTRVVSAKNLSQTWQPQIAVPDLYGGPPVVHPSMSSYGLGWKVGEYHGLRVINHAGGTSGFTAEMAFLPEADLGIVVLTNAFSLEPMPLAFAYAVQFRLLELLFAQPPGFDTALAESALALPSLALQKVDPGAVTPYLGDYANPDLGAVTLSLGDGRLLLDTTEVVTELRPLADGDPDTPVYLFHDPPLSLYSQAYGISVSLVGAPDTPQLVITSPANVTAPEQVFTFEQVSRSPTPSP